MLDGRLITIGDVSDPEISKVLTSAIESGETTFQTVWSRSLFRKMQLHVIKEKHPAKFDVCQKMLAKDPDCKFPRGVDRLIKGSWLKTKISVVDCPDQKARG